MTYFIIPIVLFCTSAVLVKYYLKFANLKQILDIPNQRSSHNLPVARGGGLAFVITWTISSLVLAYLGYLESNFLIYLLPGSIIFATLGFVDDYKSLSAKLRFGMQFFIATIFMFLIGGLNEVCIGYRIINLAWLGLPLGILSIVWSVNLFNFMDGIDGIAATESLFVFIVATVLFYQEGAWTLALMSFTLIFAILGFLVWNWPRAKVFMGDAGSYFLGFLIAAFAILGIKFYFISAIPWIIIYGLFWFDTSITLFRRILLKQKISSAHKLHAYQRLHQAGFSHKKIVIASMVLNSLLSALALMAYFMPELSYYALLTATLALSGAYLLVEQISPMKGKCLEDCNFA